MTNQDYQDVINNLSILDAIKDQIELTNFKGSQRYAYYGVETGSVSSAHRDNWIQKEIISFGNCKPIISDIKAKIYEHWCMSE